MCEVLGLGRSMRSLSVFIYLFLRGGKEFDLIIIDIVQVL